MAGTWSLGRVWLKFPEGHPQHGLEVLMRRKLMREPEPDEVFAWLSDEDFEALSQPEKRAYNLAQIEYRCAEFARLLIKWNFTEPVYDDDGDWCGEEPVTPTATGVGRLDPVTFAALWQAYNEAVIVMSPPLSQPSASGAPSEEELTLPQEPL